MQSISADNLYGLDVSNNNGIIDWPTVKTHGTIDGPDSREYPISFVFIKATEGVGYIDPAFQRNAEGVAAVDIPAGFYHYARPETANSAIDEANSFIAAVSGRSCKLPYVLDLEGASINIGAANLNSWALEWLTEVQRRTNHSVMIYTGASFAEEYLTTELSRFPLWVASYGLTQPQANNVWNAWTVFQYTDKGKVTGIPSDNVDFNVMEASFMDQTTLPTLDKDAAQKVVNVLHEMWHVSNAQAQAVITLAADAIRKNAGL